MCLALEASSFRSMVVHKCIKELGIFYIEDAFSDSFSGFSKAIDKKRYAIGFNTNKSFNKGFKRFTLAHELGHVTLHQEMLQEQELHRTTEHLTSEQEIEREADYFAINLLAPVKPFSDDSNELPFCEKSISSLSAKYQISFLASAIRTVSLSKKNIFLEIENPLKKTTLIKAPSLFKDKKLLARKSSTENIPLNKEKTFWVKLGTLC
jgi:Zn-dependent peptidase ImmA (M78 family)